MFTATIIDKKFSEGVMQVVVSFSNGTDTVVKAFNIGSELDLKRQIKNEIVRLDELSAFSKLLPNGVYDPTEATPVETDEMRARNLWFKNFTRLEQLTRLQTLGALRPNAVADLDELRATVMADFRKSYIADM